MLPQRAAARKRRSIPKTWCASEMGCRLPEALALVKCIKRHVDGIIVAITRGVSNSRLEGINGKIRLI
ncbi:transposase [Fodinicola acaciae]|uniref:transposase n=1 Tax=Fodinicola acaciae TaxID=2681555 RepID=UPI003CCCF9EB